MAEAARLSVQQGAQIIDINMGCPAKKVCNVAAGSRYCATKRWWRASSSGGGGGGCAGDAEIRTGWIQERNEPRCAWPNRRRLRHRRAGACTAAPACHIPRPGRIRHHPRGQGGGGHSGAGQWRHRQPAKARYVLDATGADGVMIGRAAQGRPWIFAKSSIIWTTGECLPPPEVAEIREVLLAHPGRPLPVYGEYSGCRIARKHIAWYTAGWRAATPSPGHVTNWKTPPAARRRGRVL